MHSPSRRRFLKTTLATAATVTLSGTKSSGQVVTISAVTCLALGLAVTTDISSEIDRALLQSLPFHAPAELVTHDEKGEFPPVCQQDP